MHEDRTCPSLDFLQQKMSSTSDWWLLLNYVIFELSDAASAELAADPVFAAL